MLEKDLEKKVAILQKLLLETDNKIKRIQDHQKSVRKKIKKINRQRERLLKQNDKRLD